MSGVALVAHGVSLTLRLSKHALSLSKGVGAKCHFQRAANPFR
jgi:hypothetical protein